MKSQTANELELICGGKEAEIEDAVQSLNKIREERFIQNGLIGQYLGSIVSIAQSVRDKCILPPVENNPNPRQ